MDGQRITKEEVLNSLLPEDDWNDGWLDNGDDDITGIIAYNLTRRPKNGKYVHQRLLVLQREGKVELRSRPTRNEDAKRPILITGAKRLV